MKRILSIDRGSLLLFLASSFFCLLCCEAFFRWKSFGSAAWSYEKMKSLRHVGTANLLQASAYQDILWELRPNLDTLFKLYPFKTNSQGLRDDEYSLAKPEGTFRVAVIGDSFTMGEGIDIENAYHAILEKRFNELQTGAHYEFINFGVAGYSLVQYVATIRHRALRYQPDLIFIGFCAANDSKLPNLEAFKHPYKVKDPGNGFFHFFFLERLGSIYKQYYEILRDRRPGYNADAEYVREEFKKIAALSKEVNIPVVLAYIDNRAASGDYALIESAAREQGFSFVNATEDFGPEVNPKHAIYITDQHPNAAANKVMADNLFPTLRDLPEFGIKQ